MSQSRSDVLAESRRKGVVTGVGVAATVALGVLIAPVAAAVAAVPTAYFGWRWWKHRAENGIRF